MGKNRKQINLEGLRFFKLAQRNYNGNKVKKKVVRKDVFLDQQRDKQMDEKKQG